MNRFEMPGLVVAFFLVASGTLSAEDEITIVVQINGKVRDRFVAPASIDNETAIATAKSSEGIAKFVEDKTIVKEIYIPGKLVNLVVRG